jgi:hypothetical protein
VQVTDTMPRVQRYGGFHTIASKREREFNGGKVRGMPPATEAAPPTISDDSRDVVDNGVMI